MATSSLATRPGVPGMLTVDQDQPPATVADLARDVTGTLYWQVIQPAACDIDTADPGRPRVRGSSALAAILARPLTEFRAAVAPAGSPQPRPKHLLGPLAYVIRAILDIGLGRVDLLNPAAQVSDEPTPAQPERWQQSAAALLGHLAMAWRMVDASLTSSMTTHTLAKWREALATSRRRIQAAGDAAVDNAASPFRQAHPAAEYLGYAASAPRDWTRGAWCGMPAAVSPESGLREVYGAALVDGVIAAATMHGRYSREGSDGNRRVRRMDAGRGFADSRGWHLELLAVARLLGLPHPPTLGPGVSVSPEGWAKLLAVDLAAA